MLNIPSDETTGSHIYKTENARSVQTHGQCLKKSSAKYVRVLGYRASALARMLEARPTLAKGIGAKFQPRDE